MKTIITNQIDGYDVIIGIDNAGKLIDPIATAKIVAKEIEKADVYKNIVEIKKQMQALAVAAIQASRSARLAKVEADRDKFTAEYQNAHTTLKNLEEQLKPLAVELKELNKSLTLKHAIYFTPAPYETIITDEEADEISTLIAGAESEGVVITKDKAKVVDNRGKRFCKKSGSTWTLYEMIKLGDMPPKNAIQDKDLTQEQQVEIGTQFEADRIGKLNKTQKVAELEAVMKGLKAQAVQMRSELEIDGDEDALSKSQDWLAKEMAKAESKYK